MATDEPKAFSVEIQKEFNVLDKSWSETVFLKLFVSMRTSGLLAALGPERTQSLINLATFMDSEGECWPSLETLAEGLGITAQAAGDRYRELANFRWNGQPIITKRLVRDPKTQKIKGTVYTILPITGLTIFEAEKPGNPHPAPTCSPLHMAPGGEGENRSGNSPQTRAPSLHVVEPYMARLHLNKIDTEKQENNNQIAPLEGAVVVVGLSEADGGNGTASTDGSSLGGADHVTVAGGVHTLGDHSQETGDQGEGGQDCGQGHGDSHDGLGEGCEGSAPPGPDRDAGPHGPERPEFRAPEEEGRRQGQNGKPDGRHVAKAEQVTRYHQALTAVGVRIRKSLVARWLRDHGPERLDIVLEVLQNPKKHMKDNIEDPTRLAHYAVEHWTLAGPDTADIAAMKELARTTALVAERESEEATRTLLDQDHPTRANFRAFLAGLKGQTRFGED